MRAENSTHRGREMKYGGIEGDGTGSVKSHKTVVNLKGGIAHSGLSEHGSDLRWSGSRRGSSSFQWDRPRARWGRDLLKPLQLWWGSTCHLHPTGIPPLKEFQSKTRGQIWGKNKNPKINHIWFTELLFAKQAWGVYLHQTDLQLHQRAEPATGRCWWTKSGPHWEFASHGTCTSTPGCLAGSPGLHCGPRRAL